MKKDEELFDLLYAFPKYRRLRNRLKEVNRYNRNKDKALRREWEEKAIKKLDMFRKKIIMRILYPNQSKETLEDMIKNYVK